MLERLKLNDFTVFQEADLKFSPGLNLFAGENGTGKTHVLKLAYSLMCPLVRGFEPAPNVGIKASELDNNIASKLNGVFRAHRLGRLVRRSAGRDFANLCTVSTTLKDLGNLKFEIGNDSTRELKVVEQITGFLDKAPVYLPPGELFTIWSGVFDISLIQDPSWDDAAILSRLADDTWGDFCRMLQGVAQPAQQWESLVGPIRKVLGGEVVLNAPGRFCLATRHDMLEMNVIAEGWRKLAMIDRLIVTGDLSAGSTMFWDEPESNLNPKLIKLIARTILHLCQNGVQVFLATHSLFLMRELDILTRNREFGDVPARYFGLHPGNDGVNVTQGDSIDDMGEIASLQEELSQSDRYLDGEGE